MNIQQLLAATLSLPKFYDWRWPLNWPTDWLTDWPTELTDCISIAWQININLCVCVSLIQFGDLHQAIASMEMLSLFFLLFFLLLFFIFLDFCMQRESRSLGWILHVGFREYIQTYIYEIASLRLMYIYWLAKCWPGSKWLAIAANQFQLSLSLNLSLNLNLKLV